MTTKNITAAVNCAKVLLSLGVPESDIASARETWSASGELRFALSCPSISKTEKHAVIEKVFPKSLHGFFKVMEKYSHIGYMSDIFESYDRLKRESENCTGAVLYAAAKPDEKTVESFKRAVCKKSGCASTHMEIIIEPSLIGGYVLKIGDKVYDRSVKSALEALQNEMIRR